MIQVHYWFNCADENLLHALLHWILAKNYNNINAFGHWDAHFVNGGWSGIEDSL